MKKVVSLNTANSKTQYAVSFQKTISKVPTHARIPSTALDKGYRPETKITTVNTEVNVNESDIVETLPNQSKMIKNLK